MNSQRFFKPDYDSEFFAIDEAWVASLTPTEKPFFDLCLTITEALRQGTPLNISPEISKKLAIVGRIDEHESARRMAGITALDCIIGGRWDLVDALIERGFLLGRQSGIDVSEFVTWVKRAPRVFIKAICKKWLEFDLHHP